MDHHDASAVQAAPAPPAATDRPAGRLSGFARDEDGSILVLGLILFAVMLMFGGFALDLMSFEAKRTDLQQSIDRCGLAAAALSQTREPVSVVNDCMAKAGKGSYVTSVQVTEGLNYREVTATASQPTNPVFAHMLGIDALDAPAATKAEQRITNVEIAMVLDVSGSMVRDDDNRPVQKLANLKSAASEFVTTILKNDLNHRISITMVPYNGQVNLGPVLRGKFNAIDPNGTANMDCLDMPAAVYATSELSRTLPMPMTANADTFSASFNTSSPPSEYRAPTADGVSPVPNNRWCLPTAANIVRLPSGEATTLKKQINDLTGNGATSINAGMKVGVALLDPGSRPLFSELAGTGAISGHFAGRPFDYDDDEAMKVIIVMTDGAHFKEERMNDGYRAGPSPIYRSANGSTLSLKIGNNNFYWPRNNTTGNATADGTNPSQLTWRQVWESYRTSYIAWQLYSRRPGRNGADREAAYEAQMDTFRTQTPTETMDDQLQAICKRAKDNGVIVFGIAFEAPEGGKTQIQKCATSPDSHYFDADGLEIQSAFRSIASQISHLRLSQ